MDYKGIILGAIAFLVLSEVINTVTAVLTLGYYSNPAYFSLWNKLMMSASGPPPIAFYEVSFLFSLITGMIFAWAYLMLKQSVPGKGMNKGFNYGMLLFLVSGIPFTFTTYLIFAVPLGLLAAWTISSLVGYALSGIAFSKIMK